MTNVAGSHYSFSNTLSLSANKWYELRIVGAKAAN